jgi:quercetin dioxygenase-like cupin family protein
MANVKSAIRKHIQMERPLGAAAAVLTWLGWLTICPALGFPVLGTAAMVNRAIFGVIDPSFWVGWVVMIAALVVAIAVFFILERAHLVRVSIRTGVIYGAALWLVAGVVLMPLLGIVALPTSPLSGIQPADPMHATVMMYTLGPFAAVAALIAWVLFGATLGATGSAQQRRDTAPGGSGTMIPRFLGAAMFAGFALAVMSSTPAQVHATNSTLAGVTVRTLAQGPVKNLPAAKVGVNIIEFRQLPGAAYGPHDHPPLFAYTLHGIATLTFPGGAPQSVGPGDAAFLPAVGAFTNENTDGRFGAGAIAVGLIVVVILLCAATSLRGGLRRVIITVLSLLLIAGGALVLTGGMSNDYYFIAVRSCCGHPGTPGTPMPVPYGRVTFSSPELDPVPAGPYIETLSAIRVAPGARYNAQVVPGPQMIIVVEGTAAVHVGEATEQLGDSGAAFAQAGNTLAIANPGSDTLLVLAFAVTPVSAVPPAT